MIRDMLKERGAELVLIDAWRETQPYEEWERMMLDADIAIECKALGNEYIVVGNESHYARDDAHKEEILTTLPKNRNYEISRFKGLGEMTAQQLKETTLDPKSRILLRVDIESQLDADKTFTELLGKDASERYRIIMDEASQVDDLDI